MAYLLGYDIGSSSVKAGLVDANSGEKLKVVHYPSREMEIISHHPGWAEQDPELWWSYLCAATKKLLHEAKIDNSDVKAIGISYQMHGLVLVDSNLRVLRPSIIWCDSRAVEIGERSFNSLGPDRCLRCLLNSPGNFTASKLRWVVENEPSIMEKVAYFMLPGDFIAMKLTGEVTTTISGLSEGILWDFENHQIAEFLLDEYQIPRYTVPPVMENCTNQGVLSKEAAEQLGLRSGVILGYRAGDQPSNAMSLNVLRPGEVAATGGTSGVVYGIVDRAVPDAEQRVNSFAHVNHHADHPAIGVLLCINGAGIQYGYIRNLLIDGSTPYEELETLAAEVPVGADGLRLVPFGNGAERMLGNQNIGTHLFNLQLNRHRKPHIFRATLEGIAFAFVYGMEVFKQLGLSLQVIRVGNDNLFQSDIFSYTIAAILDTRIQMLDTTGAVGAAKAAGLGAGIYSNWEEALGKEKSVKLYDFQGDAQPYRAAYEHWREDLLKLI